jgi:hypothetical protein
VGNSGGENLSCSPSVYSKTQIHALTWAVGGISLALAAFVFITIAMFERASVAETVATEAKADVKVLKAQQDADITMICKDLAYIKDAVDAANCRIDKFLSTTNSVIVIRP